MTAVINYYQNANFLTKKGREWDFPRLLHARKLKGMEKEKSVWEKLFESEDASAKGSDQGKNAFKDPKTMNAQKRATAYYFRTGESRPLNDFLKDESLK